MDYKNVRRLPYTLPVIGNDKYHNIIHDDFDIGSFMAYLPQRWNFSEDMNCIRLPGWEFNGKYYWTDNIERDIEAIRERDDVWVECAVATSLCILYLLRYMGTPLKGKFIADNRIQANEWFGAHLRAANPKSTRVRLKYTLGMRFYVFNNFYYEIFSKQGIPTSYQGENSVCIDNLEIAYFRTGYGESGGRFVLTNIDEMIRGLKINGEKIWKSLSKDFRAFLEEECRLLKVNGVRGRPDTIIGKWSDVGIVLLDK